MAGLNVSKWQAARRKTFYDPTMQFFLRLIRTALDEAKAVKGVPCPYIVGWYPDGEPMLDDADVNRPAYWQAWDDAVMSRDWIARETPDRHVDECGYLLSFEHCCEVLGLDADREATWMLREIDECADFDTEEIHARVQWLTDNPPDEVEEELFEGLRVVPKLDQGSLLNGGSGLRLSELNILPAHPVHSVTDVWIDGKHYEVGDDGDTLIEVSEEE